MKQFLIITLTLTHYGLVTHVSCHRKNVDSKESFLTSSPSRNFGLRKLAQLHLDDLTCTRKKQRCIAKNIERKMWRKRRKAKEELNRQLHIKNDTKFIEHVIQLMIEDGAETLNFADHLEIYALPIVRRTARKKMLLGVDNRNAVKSRLPVRSNIFFPKAFEIMDESFGIDFANIFPLNDIDVVDDLESRSNLYVDSAGNKSLPSESVFVNSNDLPQTEGSSGESESSASGDESVSGHDMVSPSRASSTDREEEDLHSASPQDVMTSQVSLNITLPLPVLPANETLHPPTLVPSSKLGVLDRVPDTKATHPEVVSKAQEVKQSEFARAEQTPHADLPPKLPSHRLRMIQQPSIATIMHTLKTVEQSIVNLAPHSENSLPLGTLHSSGQSNKSSATFQAHKPKQKPHPAIMPEGFSTAPRVCKPGPSMAAVPGLPNCLIIGDSIALSYHYSVAAALSGRCQVQLAPASKAGVALDSTYGVQCLDLLLTTANLTQTHYDVVVFNYGLHDIDYLDLYPEEKSSTRRYIKNLLNITRRVQQTGASVALALSTPVTFDAVKNDMLKKYNRAAKRAMRKSMKNLVPVIDLYSVVVEECGEPPFENCYMMKLPHDVHYGVTGSIMLGKRVAAEILNLLEQRQHKRSNSIAKNFMDLSPGSVSCSNSSARCPAHTVCMHNLVSRTNSACCMLKDGIDCGDSWHCCPRGSICHKDCSENWCACSNAGRPADHSSPKNV